VVICADACKTPVAAGRASSVARNQAWALSNAMRPLAAEVEGGDVAAPDAEAD
jgi:hypothetical protein